jgi:Ca-activated chloride channel family protein
LHGDGRWFHGPRGIRRCGRLQSNGIMRPCNKIFVTALFAGLVAQAQGPAGPSQQVTPEVGGFIFRAESRLVVLHVTVLDKNNRFVTSLTQSAFKVYENGAEQTLKLFRREDVPVSVGLVIDNSGSMRDKRQQVNAASLAFVAASHPGDEVFIVNFNDEAFLDQDFTNRQELLQDALKKVDQRGGTALYDALSMSLDHVREKGKRDKRVILLVSDGEDNASQMTFEKLLRKAQESEVAIFTVGLLEEGRAGRRTRRVLTDLAEATGGAAFFPRQSSEVDAIARRIALDIRSQYALGYTPTDPALDNTFRRIRVLVGKGNDYTVRTRSGYYARPVAARWEPRILLGAVTSPP